MFSINIGQAFIYYRSFKFSGGEIHVELENIKLEGHVAPIYIRGNIENSDSVMELLMLTDAIKRVYPHSPIDLTIPYFPYARQDRVMEKGQSLSVKVLASLVNAQGYNKVRIYDAHSDVTPALINNVEHVEQWELLNIFIRENRREDCILVAPDMGAAKKVLKAAKNIGMPMVQANKVRNTQTGEITGTEVYTDHVGNRDFLIVDDICDGGRTFTELAKVLKEKTTGNVYLYVTHGIFSKGVHEVFNGLIDGIFCTNGFSTIDKESVEKYRDACNIFIDRQISLI